MAYPRPVEKMTPGAVETGVARNVCAALALTRREATLVTAAGLAGGAVAWVTSVLLFCT